MNIHVTTNRPVIKLLAVIEATTVIGPAKNLIEFCRRARTPDTNSPGLPTVEATIVTFHRGPSAASLTAHQSRGAGNALSAITSEAPNQFVAAARAAGIEVDVIGERFRFDGRVMMDLRRIVEHRAPDIIQTHQVKSHFLMKLSGMWRQYPWIAFHHGYTTTNLKMRAYNHLNRWSLPSAQRVVTVCRAFARDLARAGVSPERISVQHNSINTGQMVSADEGRALRERLGIEEDARVVLAVGRLSREKAHVDLISALGHLRCLKPELNFRLIIVGDGPERPQVERAMMSYGLRKRVTFAGHVSDVRSYYALADLLVLPSHSEGSPNVLLEAMAVGLPIVATAVGGVPEMVEHNESGLLVAPRDPEAMAAAIGLVLSDSQLAQRLAANASALVTTRFSPESYRRSLINIYRELIPHAAIEAAPVV